MDNLISKQAAIDICRKTKWNGADDYLPLSAREIESEIRALPSTQLTQANAFNVLNALDCISRAQALNNIKSLYPEAPRINFMDSLAQWKKKYRQYIECERVIENLPSAQPKPEWVPINEAKPERCDYYLVTDSGTVGEAYYDSDRRWWADGNKLKDVTAWMPLPEPYVGDLK